ncbi:MAG: hypothetical protein HC898_02085 [Phycisphaerales bacterium]|nr:hypothetical protein [Phycisphaerales bacterium]
MLELNGMEDEWKEHLGGHPLQVRLAGNHQSFDRKYVPVKRFTVDEAPIDIDPATWQTVRIPMRFLADVQEPVEVTGIYLQFQNLPSKKAGAQVRNIRFEQ